MNQASLCLEPSVRIPDKGTQKHSLLLALQRGEKLTMWDALHQYGVAALSQRVGELKRMGWPIESELIRTDSGKHVSVYWMPWGIIYLTPTAESVGYE